VLLYTTCLQEHIRFRQQKWYSCLT